MSDNNQAEQTMPELPKAWGFARNVDGQIEIRIGPVCPPNRSGGLATPWAPMFGGDQMHQYARDYAAALSKTAGVPEGWMLAHRQTLEIVGEELARARDKVKPAERAWLADLNRVVRGMLAAVPAASGGEGRLTRAEAITEFRSRTAASVSERARELLAEAFSAIDPRRGDILSGRIVDPNIRRALRAIEQALTQQHALSSPRQDR